MTLFFDWDENKAVTNLEKHSISFIEACTVFDDPLANIFFDNEHSEEEDRFFIIGYSKNNKLLFVSYTENNTLIRIISARKATKRERLKHESRN